MLDGNASGSTPAHSQIVIQTMSKIMKMKLGRRRAYLRKCILAQDLMVKYENNTTVRSRVFEEHIEPVLLCSYQQYNNMLNVINPQRELDEIDAEIEQITNSK